MLKYWIISSIIGAALITTPSFSASPLTIDQAQTFDPNDVADDQGQFAIRPSEAALIAKNAYPDAKVLGIQLLPSGEYAVTLKVGGSVQRILVNATSGVLGYI